MTCSLDSPDHDSAIEGRLGVERRFATRWKATAELGGRGWEHADDRVLARGVLEYAPDENAVAALEVDHGDQLEHSYSLESVQQGIGRTGGKLSYWRQLSRAWEGYGEVGGAWLSDSNGEIAMGGSVAWRPFPAVDVQIALALDAMHYQDASPYYYSPDVDLGGTLSLMGRVPIHGALAFVFDAGGGAGFSQEQGTSVVRSRVPRQARTPLGSRRLQRCARCCAQPVGARVVLHHARGRAAPELELLGRAGQAPLRRAGEHCCWWESPVFRSGSTNCCATPSSISPRRS